MSPLPGRDDVRQRILTAAADLLREDGAAGVTTRAVAERAGAQAPTIYRLFGDKEGLLDAVAERALADFGAAKSAELSRDAGSTDPVEDLRRSWNQTVRFGLEHPDLFVIMSDPRRGRDSPALVAGARALEERIRRVAAAGSLRVSESEAATMIHAAGTGAVIALLEQEADARDPRIADSLLNAVLAHILTDPVAQEPEPTEAPARVAAVTLRALTPGLSALSPGERALLAEWLDRVIDTP